MAKEYIPEGWPKENVKNIRLFMLNGKDEDESRTSVFKAAEEERD